MDRKLTAGDRIHKIDSASNSQFGYCDSVKIYTTLKIKNTNKIIEKVEHRSLYNINVCIDIYCLIIINVSTKYGTNKKLAV